jgi:hypothetical protein
MGDRKTLVIIGVVVVGLLGLGALLYLSIRPEPPIQGLVQIPRPERGHDDTVAYPYEEYTLPPPGGIHYNAWQNCGIYDEPVATGNAVHSLEHGAVWITYSPDLPANQVAQLRDKVVNTTYILLSPYPNLQSPVVLSAWGVQLEVDNATDRRIDQFISRYRLGPQTPEPGAVCTHGLGNPVDRDVPMGN